MNESTKFYIAFLHVASTFGEWFMYMTLRDEPGLPTPERHTELDTHDLKLDSLRGYGW